MWYEVRNIRGGWRMFCVYSDNAFGGEELVFEGIDRGQAEAVMRALTSYLDSLDALAAEHDKTWRPRSPKAQ